jgi:hypothetical protein
MRHILSTFRNVNGEASTRGLAILVVHVGTRLPHRFDDLIEGYAVLPIARESQVRGIDRFHRPEGVALDTGNLDQTADGIAGHAKMVFDGDLRGIFDLLVRLASP